MERNNYGWTNSGPIPTTVIDYNHIKPQTPSIVPPPVPCWDYNTASNNVYNKDHLVKGQLKTLAQKNKQLCTEKPNYSVETGNNTLGTSDFNKSPAPNIPFSPISSNKYNPFIDDANDDVMEISDDETDDNLYNSPTKDIIDCSTSSPIQSLFNSNNENKKFQVNSGAAFYKGLILYIPPFEELTQKYKSSPAMKMLYASFEFSFKMPIKIETKQKENSNVVEAAVLFNDQMIAVASGRAPHVKASVRALELLSETCYTIQAKENYLKMCKMINAEIMKTLNLKKWEATCQKYPKISEVTKICHLQKTMAVFLDNHTSSGHFEDIVCCNLTRQEVTAIKSVVEFFKLTMLPCSMSTNLSKKHTPCVVAIQKHTTAQKLLDILVESGGENESFRLYPPDTFKQFYLLQQELWDPQHQTTQNIPKTLIEDEDFQTLVLTPYNNIIGNLFEKQKSLPKVKNVNDESVRKAGDDFMKENLQIDISDSKNVAPVERMQLLLKYMEQLQEYGSRVLASGHPEMIKIYHNAIENLRKDLETCRKDIEKEQKEKESTKTEKTHNKSSRSPSSKRRASPQRSRSPPFKRRTSLWRSRSPASRSRTSPRRSRSPASRRRTSPWHRSKSPRSRNISRNRSPSAKLNHSSASPTRYQKSHRSYSPHRRLKSPTRKSIKSSLIASPPHSRLLQRRSRSPSPRKGRSPCSSRALRVSPFNSDKVLASIFKDQLRRFREIVGRFTVEIEDTSPIMRSDLKDKWAKCKGQFDKFEKEALDNCSELGIYLNDIAMLKIELERQCDMILGKPYLEVLPPWVESHSPEMSSVQYPLPGSRHDYSSRIPPGTPFNHRYPY